MNTLLKETLKKEPSEELFYFFKHDGSLNFEKKIVSGIILHERKYNKRKLKSEKTIIRDSIVRSIKDYKNSPQLIKKLKNKVRRNIIFGIIITTLINSMSFIIDNTRFKSISLTDNYTWLITILGLLAFIIYSIATYNKKVNEAINTSKEDYKLMVNRLEIIDKRWDF